MELARAPGAGQRATQGLHSAAAPAPPGQQEGSGAGPSSSAASPTGRRGPAAWLRHAILRAQAVAEDRPGAEAQAGEDEYEADDASEDGGSAAGLADCASFGSLPEHLLEKIFGHLRGANRKHHFALCGVNRQWRRLGQAMFFSRPWEVAHLICHPTQLFCLSPRNVTGSRSGLLKCFVRREHGPGGKKFSFHIGKDASQPQRSRFLMAAKHGGRDTVLLYMNSRCAGPPCARLRCNLFATQYKLTISDDLHLEPTASSKSNASSAAGAAGASSSSAAAYGPGQNASMVPRPEFGRLTSWSAEAAAEAAVAAHRLQRQLERSSGGAGGCELRRPASVSCFAELQYQARVKGFMQPRRMRVLLPHPSLLFYDQALPQLSRRNSESAQSSAAPSPHQPALLGPANSSAGASGAFNASGGSSGRRAVLRSLSAASSGGGAAAASPAAAAASPEDAAGLDAAAGSRFSRWLQRVGRRRQVSGLLRQHKSVLPVGEPPGLAGVVLQNKAPHWNEGLRCWCLNFRGRVKLASVKNFQLVRADDASERVVMQFGKAEQDAFILDFNPTVLTAMQAFGVVLSTFDSKVFL